MLGLFLNKIMEKTTEEWFNLIKDPVIRRKALFNMRTATKDRKRTSLASALTSGFDFTSSPENRAYWWKIYMQLSNGTLNLLNDNDYEIY